MESDPRAVMIQQKLHEYYSMIESLKKMMNTVLQDQEVITNALVQLNQAGRTLSAMDEKKGESVDMMVPVGGSAFITGSMKVSPRALVKIGTGLLAEKDIPDAIETLNGRSEDLEKGIKENEERLRALQEKERLAVAQIEDLKSLLSTAERN